MNAARRTLPVILLLCLLGISLQSHAQSPESDAADTMLHLPPPPPSVIPDFSDKSLQFADYENRHFTFKPGLSVLLDYTSFDQDAASYSQVGNQEDKLEFRSFRFIGRGDLRFLSSGWSYMLSAEYKGFDSSSDVGNWQTSDLWIQLNAGNTRLRIGKQKESFVYEMVGDAANLPQSERLLSPFFVSRNVGVSWTGTVLDNRASWSIGWFNDAVSNGDSFSNSGNDFTARLTALPVLDDEDARYLHLGLAARYYGGDDNQLRFKGRPESNVADNYVDTGSIPGDHAWQAAAEVLWADRHYSILTEYVRAWARSSVADDPQFSGYYVTFSYVPNGLPRPYDTKVAYARRVPVTTAWGSVEFVLRYGHIDLDDGVVSGGTLDKWFAAVNWWATKRIKASIGYGDADLDRFATTGNTRSLLTRLQWIY